MSPLLASIIFTFMAHAVFSGMRLAVALDAIDMGASAALVGAITALFAMLPALGSVPMGRVIDRKGGRALTLICPLVLAASALLAAAVPSLVVLALASLLTGGAFITLQIINQQLVGRLSKAEDRTANFALSATWFAASSALAPMAAGYAIDHVGFRWTFLLLGVVPLLSLAFLAVGKPPRLSGRNQAKGEKATSSGGVIGLLSDARLRRIYLVNVLFATSWDVFLFMTPIYGASLKLSASQIGTIIACFASATFVVRLLARPISRRYTPWQVLLVSLVINGAANLAFGLSSFTTLLMIFAFTMGMGHGMANPMMNTLLYEGAPPTRVAEVMGLRTSVSMSLQVAMPVAAGALGALIGIAPLFWLVSAGMLGGAASWRRNWHMKRAAGASRSASPPQS